MRKLQRIAGQFAVCKIARTTTTPEWATGEFVQLSYSSNECTIVCEQDRVPKAIESEKDWFCFRIAGELQFDLIGVIAEISRALADSNISVFAISTFDTDYFLVKSDNLEKAKKSLSKAGYQCDNF